MGLHKNMLDNGNDHVVWDIKHLLNYLWTDYLTHTLAWKLKVHQSQQNDGLVDSSLVA